MRVTDGIDSGSTQPHQDKREKMDQYPVQAAERSKGREHGQVLSHQWGGQRHAPGTPPDL